MTDTMLAVHTDYDAPVIEGELMEEESNLVQHARYELALLGNGPEIDDHVIEMVKIFSSAGHSGYSGMYTIELIRRVLLFENLTPLTNDPAEWNHVAEERWGSPKGIWQNRRNGSAFSHDGGKTYYLLEERQGRTKRYHLANESNKEKTVAVKHKLYKNKTNHNEVRAIRVTARNFINVANWCDGEALVKILPSGDEVNQRVKVKGLVAQVGDFVVRETVVDKNDKIVNQFRRIKDDEFEAAYSLA